MYAPLYLTRVHNNDWWALRPDTADINFGKLISSVYTWRNLVWQTKFGLVIWIMRNAQPEGNNKACFEQRSVDGSNVVIQTLLDMWMFQ